MVIHNISRINKKNFIIVSVDAENVFDKILQLLMVKNNESLPKLGLRENSLT